VYAHIQLTDEEVKAWEKIPTMYNDHYVGDCTPLPVQFCSVHTASIA
jgi:hypothetical protein